MDCLGKEGFRTNLHTTAVAAGFDVQVLGSGGKFTRYYFYQISKHVKINTNNITNYRTKFYIGFSPPSAVSEPIAIGQGNTRGIENKEERLLKEAKATLSSSHVVDLIEAVPVSSTSIKLVWEVKNT